MALPVISNNNPAAGSISWTAFAITYNGVSYSVAASNTAFKFTYWQYNAGAPVLVGTNTLPSMATDDLLLFLNKGGVGVLVPTTDVLDGHLIVAGSIFADAIAANQINSTHIIANAITAEELAAGAVSATHISAGAITTDKLGVGSVGDSLVTNGSFEEFANSMPIGWSGTVSGGAGSVDIVTGVASSGTNAARLVVGATTSTVALRQTTDRLIPVTSAASRKWYIGAMIGAGTATTNGLYLRAVWFDANKTYISYSEVITASRPVTTTFQLFEGQATPPSTARYMQVEIQMVTPNVITNVYVDEVVAREVVISAQIGDGAITAAKILANTITGDRIAGGTITGDKILVTDRTNYWENPDFEGDTVGGIPRGTTLTGTTNSRVLGAGADGSGKSLELNALNGSNNDVFGSNTFPVKPGDQYYVRMDYKFLNAVGTSSAGVGFRTYGPTKAGITWTLAAFANTRPTAWTAHPGAIYTVPAGTYFLQPWVTFANNAETTNRFHVDNIVIRRLSAGELIVDGSIIASKIATDAVSADKILANAVTADKIQANAITANKIAADAIDGKTITGATVRTAASGARIVMDSTGLNGWDANNVNYLKADSTGLKVTGDLQARGDGIDYNNYTWVNGVRVYAPYPVDINVGKSVVPVQGIQTESSGGGSAPLTIPGVTFTPVNTPMYEVAGMTAPDGQYVTITSGVTQAEQDAYDAYWQSQGWYFMKKDGTFLSLAADVVTTNKPMNAPSYRMNGAEMSAGESVTFTGSGTINSLTLTTLGNWTKQTSQSTSPNMASISGSEIQVATTGVYDVFVQFAMGGGFTGRSFVEIVADSQPYGGSRSSLSTNEDSGSTALIGIKLTAGDKISSRAYATTDGTKNTGFTLRLVKVAAPLPVAQWESGSLVHEGDVTINGTTYVKKLDNAAHWTASWTSGAIPYETLWGPGQPAPTTGTTDSTLISWPANDTLQFRDAGIYSMSVQLRQTSGVSNGSGSQAFVSFEPASGTQPAYTKGFMGPNENQCTASIANIKVTAGQQMKCYVVLYTQGGGSAAANWRINVTRIG